MSIPEFSKAINIQNESAKNIKPNQQENTNPAIDMDPSKKKTVTPRPFTIAKSKEIVCIDMENVLEPQDGIRDQLETGPVTLPGLTDQMKSQSKERLKLLFKGLYEKMRGYGRQSATGAPGLIWNQIPLLPEQAVWMQYGPTQIQIPPHSPLGGPNQVQDPVKPTGPQFIQAQGGYPGYGPPQNQGYGLPQYPGYGPPQNQGYGPPQNQGYGPPQNQGYGPPQNQGFVQGFFGNQSQAPAQGGGVFGFGQANNNELAGEPFEYDPETRNSFIRLVMFIVFVMFVVTAGAAAAAYFTPAANAFFRKARWETMIVSLVLLMTANYGLTCYPCGRFPPGNIICLILAVLAMILMVCKVICRYRIEIIIYALIATAAVVLICVMLACTSFDFTSYALYIIMAAGAISIIFLIVALVTVVTGQMMKPVMIVLLIVSTLVQVFVLTMELQMVIGGKAIQISESDYALAAFMIYMSIIEIFLNLVKLLGLLDS